MDLNKVILCGRLTKDVDVKYLSNGTAIGNFSLAVNRKVKKDEQWVDEPVFIECAMFGKLVESIKSYMTKGKQLNVVGELKQDRWEDQQGGKHSKHSVVVNDVQLLGGLERADTQQQTQNYQPKIAPQATVSYQQNGFDDIPF